MTESNLMNSSKLSAYYVKNAPGIRNRLTNLCAGASSRSHMRFWMPSIPVIRTN